MAFSLGSLLSGPGLTAISNTVGSYEDAQKQAKQVQLNQAIQGIQLNKQLQQTQIENDLHRAQTNAANARATKYGQTPPDEVVPVPTAGGLMLLNKKDGSLRPALDQGGTQVQPVEKPEPTPIPTATGYVDRGGHPMLGDDGQPLMPPSTVPKETKDHFTSTGAVDSEGHPIILNTATGQSQSGQGTTKAGGQSGTAQAQQARMLAAVSEARLADERMRKFEDDLLSGKQNISPLTQAGGQLMTNLSGSHGALGALGQAGSEAALNATNPSYTQYLRDAMTIGRAEQMISPRGGNETMVRANSLLARAGTGANKATIDASRMARQALFGQAGGVAQSMTPDQTTKLNKGIQTIKAGDTGGNVDLAKPTLQERVQQLKAQGLTKEAARVQLVHEGLLPPSSDE